MTKNKKIVIVLSAVIAVLLILAIVAMILFVPKRGERNDTEYWSEYDVFDIAAIPEIEMTGDEFRILQLADLHYSTQYYHDEDMLGGTLITISADSSVTVDGYYLV